MREHTRAHNICDSKSPLHKHDVPHHNGVQRDGRYEADIVSTHRHNMGRFVTEGKLILEVTNFLGQKKDLNQSGGGAS